MGKHSQLTPAADLRLHSNCSDTTVPLECIFLSLFQSLSLIHHYLHRILAVIFRGPAHLQHKVWQKTASNDKQDGQSHPKQHYPDSRCELWTPKAIVKSCPSRAIGFKKNATVSNIKEKQMFALLNDTQNQIRLRKYSLSICCKNKLIIAYTLISNVIKLEFLNIYFK